MNDEMNIPLLEDLVYRGQVEAQESDQKLDSNENQPIEIFAEEMEIEQDLPDEITPYDETQNESTQTTAKDELIEHASVKELLIDEEIRIILDKHMDKAYEEIIRLLNHKIS